MALTTLSGALTQYNTNLVWEGDPTKAVLFLEAVRWLIGNRPMSNTMNSASTSLADLRDQEKRAADYVARCGTTATARRCSWTRGQMSV
jgi:hypothetical protein